MRLRSSCQLMTSSVKAYAGACLAEMALPEVAFLRHPQVVSPLSEPKDESGRSFERPKDSLHKVVLGSEC